MIRTLLPAARGTLALASLALFASLAFPTPTPAAAAARHHRHHHPVAGYHGSPPAAAAGPREVGGHAGYPTAFRLPQNPRVWDCVHVVFPQCDRGYDGLNDGSFR